MTMAADKPDRYVVDHHQGKAHGKILVDYLRNQRGATAVAAYSTRARPGASVSMPLAWDELGPDIGPAHFTVYNTPQRLAAQKSDPWEGFRAAAKPLPVKPRRQGCEGQAADQRLLRFRLVLRRGCGAARP